MKKRNRGQKSSSTIIAFLLTFTFYLAFLISPSVTNSSKHANPTNQNSEYLETTPMVVLSVPNGGLEITKGTFKIEAGKKFAPLNNEAR